MISQGFILIHYTQLADGLHEQKEFQRQAEACRSKYVIVRSVVQGINAVKEYLQ